ncbi:aminopeptidase P N-terminal domain-containing protein [candidate division KSB1 bacterium]
MRKRFSLTLLFIFLFGFSTLSSGGVFDKAEYKSRRVKLMKSIPDGIAVIIGSEGEKQNSNFIYFTGVEEPYSILIIDGMKEESILFLPSVESSEKVIEETGVDRVMPVSRFARQLTSYQAQTDIIYTPFSRDDAGYVPKGLIDPDNRLSREMNFVNQIKERFPLFKFQDLSRAIGDLRVIKSPAEIEVMRESARISSLAHIEVLRSARPGMYEWELAALFEYTIKRLGGQGFGYDPIVPSVPEWYDSHYSENSRKIEDGDMVMPDVGGEYKYYVIDISATFPINGKFTPEQKRLNRIICAVEEAMRKVFRPGIRSIDMPAEVQAILDKQGIDMEKEGVYRIEANHWIGLDIHDVIGSGPSSRTTYFKPGMVLACDPAIKIRDENGNVIDGVKIENTVLITENGCENLTYLVPRTVEEIEKVMAEKGILEILKEQDR